MLTAKRYPEPEKGGRGNRSDKLREISKSFDIKPGYATQLLSQARKGRARP
jgi:hypothetical protein